MLRSIAFVISRYNDGLSEDEIAKYIYSQDEFDKEFVSFCIQFSIENRWLERTNDEDRYSLTVAGRKFLVSQFG
jgi:hypothetical protein